MQQNDETPNTDQQEVSLGGAVPPAASQDEPVTNTAPASDAAGTGNDPVADEAEVAEPMVDNTVYRANAKEDFAIRSELKPNQKPSDVNNTISLLYTTLRGVGETLSKLENAGLSDPASSGDWLRTIQAAEQFIPFLYDENTGLAAWREGSQWRQFVEHEGKRLRVAVPKIEGTTGEKLSGDAAVRRVQSLMGLGTHLQWPLWNSGIWVTFVPPTEDAILELQERINLEKITLGRQTRGAVFDNYQVYIVDHVMSFIKRHISAVTLKVGPEGLDAAIDEFVLISDIPNLMMGILCTMYPNGYEFTQPCTADITKCTEVFHGMVSLSKMAWVDGTRLNDSQRKLMSRTKVDSITPDEVRKYQSEFAEFKGSTIELRDNIHVVLQVPNVAAYLDFGRRWVDGIERDTTRVFGTELVGREREEYMFQQAVLSTLQAYSHWYKRLVIRGEDADQYVEDRATLESLAKTLSSDATVITRIERGIREFNDEATCTIVGITNFECPKCKQTQLRPDAKQQVIIPIDVVGTFFTLLSSRLAQKLSS